MQSLTMDGKNNIYVYNVIVFKVNFAWYAINKRPSVFYAFLRVFVKAWITAPLAVKALNNG